MFGYLFCLFRRLRFRCPQIASENYNVINFSVHLPFNNVAIWSQSNLLGSLFFQSRLSCIVMFPSNIPQIITHTKKVKIIEKKGIIWMTIYVNYRKIKIFTLITATGLSCFHILAWAHNSIGLTAGHPLNQFHYLHWAEETTGKISARI